ncbi:hypothetical protein [Streptomyces inhibens]|uniref:hypothetical protein n=1 Tax=Streptomyces inhibens TaxID=2293571 RepID=UPI001EE6D80D|nr:hypothetical protein [Streptomyces inhibens]UKY47492.1 hypothetical protein KI385_00595 [Streptomyces inhibens]
MEHFGALGAAIANATIANAAIATAGFTCADHLRTSGTAITGGAPARWPPVILTNLLSPALLAVPRRPTTFATPTEPVAKAIGFALDQPVGVDVNTSPSDRSDNRNDHHRPHDRRP